MSKFANQATTHIFWELKVRQLPNDTVTTQNTWLFRFRIDTEVSVSTYKTTRCKNPEADTLNAWTAIDTMQTHGVDTGDEQTGSWHSAVQHLERQIAVLVAETEALHNATCQVL